MKTFLNLTNGLLWEGDFDGFTRIQSCHCERKCWEKVILNLDNNFLMWLVVGCDIQIVDFSARKEIPRALYQGLEWVWFACCRNWGIDISESMVRNTNVIGYWETEYRKLSKDAIKKLTYFRKFLNNPKKPTIISGRTDKDGDYNFFTEKAKQLKN